MTDDIVFVDPNTPEGARVFAAALRALRNLKARQAALQAAQEAERKPA